MFTVIGIFISSQELFDALALANTGVLSKERPNIWMDEVATREIEMRHLFHRQTKIVFGHSPID